MSDRSTQSPFENDLWTRAHRLFDRLVELDESERQAVLEQETRLDSRLRRLVDRLLAADLQTSSPLDTPLLETAVEFRKDRGSSLLGAYRLLEEVGRGGAGIVFRAARQGGDFDQEVAVKILQHSFRRGARRRFHRERRILARLEHPSIARLIDGGATEDGQPYVVIEWIDGIPITDWCAEQALNIRERLELFCRVAEAVAYAHRHLVIHRDLKPANILINREGDPKLLDFGIATLLEAEERSDGNERTEPDHEPTRTRDGHWLTPGWASPEQILGGSTHVSTDVYNLGLLLYALLTGDSPQPKSPTELVRFAAEGVVTPPSRRPDSPETVSSTTNHIPPRHHMRGDLDAIVLQALERNPDLRYGSPEALIEDLRRYLAGHPVEARSAGTFYRLRKLVQRHVLAVSALVLLALATLGFAFTATLQSRQVARERDLADERRMAAETVSELLVETLELLDPATGHRADARSKAILDQGRATLEARSAGDDSLRAALLLQLGSLYRRLAHYEDSATLLQESLTLRQQDSSSALDSLGYWESLAELGRLDLDRGRLEAAQETLATAVEGLEGRDPIPGWELGSALHSLSTVSKERGDYQEAERLLRRAITHLDHLGASDLELVPLELDLAEALGRQNRVEASEDRLEQAAQTLEASLGGDHPRVGKALHYLGTVRLNSGRWHDAAEPLRRALEIRTEYYGEDHPSTLASLANLAATLGALGERREAILLSTKVLELDRQVLGDEHPYVAIDHMNLGLLHWQLDQAAQALPHLRECVAMRRRLLPPDSLETAIALDNLGLVLLDLGSFEEARTSHLEALGIRRKRPAEESWHHGDSLLGLAQVELARGDGDSARHRLDEAAMAFASGLPEGEGWQGGRLESLRGAVRTDDADSTEVESLLRSGFGTLLEMRGGRDRFTRDAGRRLASWLRQQGREEEALRIDRQLGKPR